MKLTLAERDPSLPHQIVIMTGRTVNETAVSCNCMKYGHAQKPMGFVKNGEGSIQKLVEIYNTSAHDEWVCREFPFHPDIEWGDRKEMEVQ
jgi:hypothetical protein